MTCRQDYDQHLRGFKSGAADGFHAAQKLWSLVNILTRWPGCEAICEKLFVIYHYSNGLLGGCPCTLLCDTIIYPIPLFIKPGNIEARVVTSVTGGGQRLCFHPYLFVCLSACEQAVSKSCGWIRTKQGGRGCSGIKCKLFSLVELCALLSGVLVHYVSTCQFTRPELHRLSFTSVCLNS